VREYGKHPLELGEFDDGDFATAARLPLPTRDTSHTSEQ
jgi:hypothetical protein